MSLWQRGITGPPAQDWIPKRGGPGRGGPVNADTALRNSAVWGCLRLRANVMSVLPVDVFRRVEGWQVEMAKPAVLDMPDGEAEMCEWMFSTTMDLDRFGNTVGLVTARDAAGRPARIELQPMASTTFRIVDGRITKVRIRGTEYDYSECWHEKQYTVGGLPFGLSPIAYAAWTLGEYSSITAFAQQWFDNGTMPSATLKNTDRVVPQKQADEVKDRYRASVSAGDLFVFGRDWEFSPITMDAAGSQWLEAKQYGDVAITRFLDVPADMIDAAPTGHTGDIVYSNITQKNLQMLIINLQGMITRRENRFSRLLVPAPRYVKLNTGALLRMDPVTRAAMFAQQITSRTLAVSEAREHDNLPPLTPAQIEEFNTLFGKPGQAPAKAATSGGTP